MRIKVDTIKDLNEQLEQHPAIKGLRLASGPTKKKSIDGSASSVQKLVEQAMLADPRIGSVVNGARRVAQCRDEGRALLRKSLRGERAGERAARQYAKKWAGIEHDYHSVVALSYELASSNKALAAYGQAAKDIDDIHRFANPALLDKTQRALLTKLGANIDDLTEAYRYGYLPDRKQLDRKIATMRGGIPAEGRKNVEKMAFLYAPERLLEKGVLTLGGAFDPVSVSIAIAVVTAAVAMYFDYLAWLEDQARTALQRTGNWMLFLFLWLVYNDIHNRLAQEQAHLAQLQNQYDEELRLLAAVDHETATAVETPAAVAVEFGYVIGNMSTSKREVHVPNCEFIHLIRPDHLRTFDSLVAARAEGLDNCHYCIGSSTR